MSKTFEGWFSVYESGIDYECEMVRDRLESSGIPALIMTKKDSAFKLTVGALSRIYVMVEPERKAEAAALLMDQSITLEELTQAALSTNPDSVAPPEDSIESKETGPTNRNAE